MPRHALRSELAAKLSDGWTGPAGRHVIDTEMPSPTGVARRHALASEVDAIVVGPGETTPTFHGVAQNRGFATTNTVGAVTGTVIGDVLLAFAGGSDQTASVTPPAGLGWTQVGDSGLPAAGRLYVYAATATATDQAGGTWTWSGSHNHAIAVLAYGGATQPTTAATAHVSNAGTVTAPSVTSTAANAMLIAYAWWSSTGGTSPVWPGTMTVRSPALATNATGLGAEESLPTPAATGTRVFSLTGTSVGMSAASLILEPG